MFGRRIHLLVLHIAKLALIAVALGVELLPAVATLAAATASQKGKGGKNYRRAPGGGGAGHSEPRAPHDRPGAPSVACQHWRAAARREGGRGRTTSWPSRRASLPSVGRAWAASSPSGRLAAPPSPAVAPRATRHHKLREGRKKKGAERRTARRVTRALSPARCGASDGSERGRRRWMLRLSHACCACGGARARLAALFFFSSRRGCRKLGIPWKCESSTWPRRRGGVAWRAWRAMRRRRRRRRGWGRGRGRERSWRRRCGDRLTCCLMRPRRCFGSRRPREASAARGGSRTTPRPTAGHLWYAAADVHRVRTG